MIQSDKGKLKNLVVSDTYNTLIRLKEEMTANWNNQLPSGAKEFDYLRNALERDGKIQGVRAFIQEIERLASYD